MVFDESEYQLLEEIFLAPAFEHFVDQYMRDEFVCDYCVQMPTDGFYSSGVTYSLSPPPSYSNCNLAPAPTVFVPEATTNPWDQRLSPLPRVPRKLSAAAKAKKLRLATGPPPKNVHLKRTKKKRLVWTKELHRIFLETLKELGDGGKNNGREYC